jgi:hypothetical protein
LINNKRLLFDKLAGSINVGLYASYGFGTKGRAVIDGETVELENIYKDSEWTVNGERQVFKAFNPFDFGSTIGFKFLLYDKVFIHVYSHASFINTSRYDRKMRYEAIGLSAGYLF